MPSLREVGLDEVLVIMGGTIPEVDFKPLQEVGIDRVFLPGIPGAAVADYIYQQLRGGAAPGVAAPPPTPAAV
jgi:methylmalonyl-CoA mutase C-terminal domain/subunit